MKPHCIPRISQSLTLLLSLLVISACSKDQPGTQNIVAQGGKNAVAVKTRAIPPGDANCVNGGIIVDSGIDENGNGLLDANEVDASEKVCNGLKGNDGSNGSQGETGASGLNSLISLSRENVGVNCPNGGVKIESGLDTNRSNILEPAEVTDVEFLCNSSSVGTNGDGNTNSPSNNFSQATYDTLNATDVSRGGMLYDKWWEVTTSATQPVAGNNHPLWPEANTQVADSDTWRCQECHGWDYRGKDGVFSSGQHYTGYAGIVTTTTSIMTQTTAENVYTFLKDSVTHGFGNGFFTEEEYYRLTKFIMTMRAEANNNLASFNFIGNDKLAIGASITNGKNIYEGSGACSVCHGTDGKKLDFADANPSTEPNEFLHNVAQENPWEFVHRIRFGTPGSLPTMIGLYDQTISANTLQAAIDILGYAQNSLIPNVNRAGLLYDKWWETSGVKVSTIPTIRNPIWAANPNATQDSTLISDDSTWQCVQCHGWDYQGVSGAFADTNIPHYSGTAGFTNSQSKTKEILIDAIANGTCSGCDVAGHSFSQFLSTSDIDLLATFILNLASPNDYNNALNSTDTTTGQAIYKSNVPGHCENCHGIDGKIIPVVDLPVTASTNPQKFLHKARYGYPGSVMVPPNQGFLGLSLSEAGSVLAYSKTLNSTTNSNASYEAASLVRGGRLYDNWWSEMQTNDTNVQKPTGINPFYQSGRSFGYLPELTTGNEDASWRCKTCHGWNYKGVGYYTGTAADSAGADNLIYKTQLRRQIFSNDEAQVRQHFFNWVKNGYGTTTHQFGQVTTNNTTPMKDQDIWDLVKFLLNGGLINTDTYILSSGLVIGTTIVNGQGLYNGSVSSDVNCSTCHGVDGVTPPPTQVGGSGAPLDIFAIAAATNNPWEFVHKVRFGQPGTTMPGTTGLPILTEKDAYDVLGYAQKRFNDRQTVQ